MALIWTTHALERISQRKILRSQAEETFYNPDRISSGKEKDTTQFRKKFGIHTITLIAKKNEKGEWVTLSTWIDPPHPGTADYSKKQEWHNYKKAGFWGKLFYTIKRQLGV